MEHVNGWCFRGIYKGGLWEDDLHVSAQVVEIYVHLASLFHAFHAELSSGLNFL